MTFTDSAEMRSTPWIFSKAMVKPPASSFADGITSAGLGPPDLEKALEQHAAYCDALERCGLKIISLDPEPAFPDSTFVEDAAIVTDKIALITRPGAPSRRGEIASVGWNLMRHFNRVNFVSAPRRLDGGDVMQIDDRFLIGISERTSEEGAHELAEHLSNSGYEAGFFDIRGMEGLLHLKSGMSYLGDNRVLVIESVKDEKIFDGLEIVRVPRGEEYAANCIRVNDHVLTPDGYPETHEKLSRLGYTLIKLDMSEFRKMDGGLSCLSLRF